MDVQPMPPIGHAPAPAAADAPLHRSTLSRVAFPLALTCSVITAVTMGGLTLVGRVLQDYAGEAAADRVDSDGSATLACLVALVLAAIWGFIYRSDRQ